VSVDKANAPRPTLSDEKAMVRNHPFSEAGNFRRRSTISEKEHQENYSSLNEKARKKQKRGSTLSDAVSATRDESGNRVKKYQSSLRQTLQKNNQRL